MKAIWQGVVLAESDDCVVVDGYTYFPREAVRPDVLKPSDTKTRCFWKGTASYYDVEVNGRRNRDAAWEYRDPSQEAQMVKNRIGFWRGVEVNDRAERGSTCNASGDAPPRC
jgi:uncharacterized protein (DUF427 family)